MWNCSTGWPVHLRNLSSHYMWNRSTGWPVHLRNFSSHYMAKKAHQTNKGSTVAKEYPLRDWKQTCKPYLRTLKSQIWNLSVRNNALNIKKHLTRSIPDNIFRERVIWGAHDSKWHSWISWKLHFLDKSGDCKLKFLNSRAQTQATGPL